MYVNVLFKINTLLISWRNSRTHNRLLLLFMLIQIQYTYFGQFTIVINHVYTLDAI